MRIVYTFISDIHQVPEYTKYSLQMARKKNPCLQIDFICKKHDPMFDEYNINWISQDCLSDGSILKRFNEVCKFNRHGKPNTTYPSAHDFWHRTAERVFYLQEYISREKLTDVFHLENDVIMYHSVESTLYDTSKDKISVVMMSHTHTTFAFCHIPVFQKMEKLCSSFIEMLDDIGEKNMIIYGGYDHISEMSLLNLALRNKIVRSFPVLPGQTKYVYDPGSYGQYFGGTNNGHGPGFIDPTHYVGSAIAGNHIHPEFNDRTPMVDGHKIFNLHIHSKNLKDFIL